MKTLRKIYARLMSKFIISRLKKGGVDSELFLRLLIHYMLVSMIDKGSDVEITYQHEDYNCKLELNARLVEGGDNA